MCKVQLLSLLILSIFYRMADAQCNYLKVSDYYFPTDVCVGYTGFSYMYACSSDNTMVAYSSYSTDDCSGTMSSSFNITVNTTLYSFMCGGDDCDAVYGYASYGTTDCSGTATSDSAVGFVAGMCYNSSGVSTSYSVCCTDSSFTYNTYTDSMCKEGVVSFSYTGCISGTSTSVSYSTSYCGADAPACSSQLPSFSAFVSFVVIALAFFSC